MRKIGNGSMQVCPRSLKSLTKTAIESFSSPIKLVSKKEMSSSQNSRPSSKLWSANWTFQSLYSSLLAKLTTESPQLRCGISLSRTVISQLKSTWVSRSLLEMQLVDPRTGLQANQKISHAPTVCLLRIWIWVSHHQLRSQLRYTTQDFQASFWFYW